MAVKSVIEAVREAMHEELTRDPAVLVMGEDIGKRGGVFLATQGFVDEFGPNRVIDTPLAEASIVGIALGASFRGLRPIAEVEFADCIWPTANQLIGEASRACYGIVGSIRPGFMTCPRCCWPREADFRSYSKNGRIDLLPFPET